jgi:putative ABC transport system permease protein
MSLTKFSLLQLKRKKIRTLVLILSIMLALSLFIGLNAGVAGMQKSYTDLVSTSLGFTDLIVNSNTTSLDFPTDTIEPLLNNASIAGYSCRVQHWMPFASVDGNFSSSSGGYLIGINPTTDEPFGSYKVTAGNCTSISQALANGDNSCVLGESFAKRLNLSVGDILVVGYYNQSQALPKEPTQTLNLTVEGIIQDNGRTYWFNSDDPTSFSKISSDITVNLHVAQSLFYLNSTDATYIYVHLQDLKQAQTVQADLQNKLGSNYTVGNLKGTLYQSLEQNFSTYQTISSIIGGMALMIAAMLLLNTMLANISERKREIGILRSIGSSKVQVFGVFMAELLPVTFVGVLASIPLSMVTARLITSILPALYVANVGTASSIEFSFPLSSLISGLVIGTALTLIVGLVPALLACRVKPIEALHPQMRSVHATRKMRLITPIAGFILLALGLFLVQNGFSASTSWFPTVTALVGYAVTLIGAILCATIVLPPLSAAFSQLLRPFTGRAAVLVHRNILLNFRRSVFSYGAFAISIALLVSFSSLVSTAASYNLAVDKQSVGSDMQFWVNAPANFTDQLKAVEGVQHVAGVGYISYEQSNFTFNGHSQDQVMVTGVASKDYFDAIYGIHLTSTLNGMSPEQVYASVSQDSGNIILQDALAQNLTMQVGDFVVWSITNQTGTYQQNLRVIATTDFVSGRWETISSFAQGYYTALISFSDMQAFRTPLYANDVDEFYISINPSANLNQVKNDLSQTCQNAGYNPTIYTAEDTLAQTKASFDQTELLAVSVTAFFVIVGALGITAATAYTVIERKREIGVLTALGMDKRQNRIIIAGEALLLALIGTAIGFASGLGLSLFVIHAIPWWANIPLPSLVISPLTMSAAALVIVVSAVISSVYPARQISKLKTVDMLR